jgi:hypothetical protein
MLYSWAHIQHTSMPLTCEALCCSSSAVQECLVLVQAVQKSQGVELITARLQQFKETVEEGQNGVGVILQCFLNMIEIDPEMADALSHHSELVTWLVNRIHVQKFPKFDENKGLAAQLLATLAQVLFSRKCHLHVMQSVSGSGRENVGAQTTQLSPFWIYVLTPRLHDHSYSCIACALTVLTKPGK